MVGWAITDNHTQGTCLSEIKNIKISTQSVFLERGEAVLISITFFSNILIFGHFYAYLKLLLIFYLLVFLIICP